MNIDYVLTTFSPAMFGEKASAHIRIIPHEEALALVSEATRVVATRLSHDRLARGQFSNVSKDTARYAMLKPGTNAIHLHYRGPQVEETGEVPLGGMVNLYLIEVDEYQESET